MGASTSRTLRGVIQLTAYVRGSRAPGSVYRSSVSRKLTSDLNPINNLWNHLDRVVRAMDPSRVISNCSNRVGMTQHLVKIP
ncbi:hypothetical protein TNCV_4508701 [Trichonephila clavipes]|nr:hypothetical protein TNCV_4508701 [Trichonephila clavipes]